MYSSVEVWYHNRAASHSDRFQVEPDYIAYLLEQQEKLEESHKALRAALSNDSKPNDEALQVLSDAESAAAELGGMVEACYDLIPPSELPTEESAVKAMEVFETTELMENILSFLDFHELFTATEVNRAMRDTVIGSAKLQKAMGLLPDEDAFLSTPMFGTRYNRYGHWSSLPSYKDFMLISYRDEWARVPWVPLRDSHRLNIAEFAITYTRDTASLQAPQLPKLPRLGSRVRSLLPIQPPVKKLAIKIQDYHGAQDRNGYSHYKTLELDRYITLGDMYDAALEAQLAARAQLLEWGTDAVYTPPVKFKGVRELREDDPVVLERLERIEARKARRERRRLRLMGGEEAVGGDSEESEEEDEDEEFSDY